MNTSELFLAFVRRLIFSFFVILLVSTASHAQAGGTVGIYTRQISVFHNQSSTASAAIFPDFGFGANYLSYQTNAFTGTVTVEWSPTGVAPFYVIAQASYASAQPDTAYHILQVGGYWPNMRSTVTPTSGNLSAWYTASASPIPLYSAGLGSNGPTSPIICDRNALVSITTGTTADIAGPLLTNDTVVICSFTVTFPAAPSTGNVIVEWGTTNSCGTVTGPSWESYTSATTPVFLPVSVQQRSPFNSTYPYACFVNNSGGGVIASFSYASVHGL